MGKIALGASKTPLEAALERFFGAGDVLVRHHLVQGVPVPGLLEVDHRAEDEPERVITEVSADGVLTALHQWLALVVRASTRPLPGHQIQYSLPSSRLRHVEEAEQVLVGVPRAHPAPKDRLEQGRRPRRVAGGHRLIRVFYVDQAVGVDARCAYLEDAGQPVPVVLWVGEGLIDGGWVEIPVGDGLDRRDVYPLASQRFILLPEWVLALAKGEDGFLGLTGP